MTKHLLQLDLFANALALMVPTPPLVQEIITPKPKAKRPLRLVTRRKAAEIAKAAAVPANDVPPIGENFRLTGTRGLARGWKARAKDNIAAIRLLQNIEASNRPATAVEQADLIKFCAFSSSELAQNAFVRKGGVAKEGWEDIAHDLAEAVTDHERAGLMRATQYAHYTPEFIIHAMWKTVGGMGFTGGRVLEPGCGVGLFMAASPEDIADKISFFGVENDPISARIAAKILPQAVIVQQDFTKATLPDNFDLAIGNPPFSDRTVRDARTGQSFSLHDYFILRSLAALRPGAIAAFVVSRWTMDKINGAARWEMTEVANFLGAVRLPAKALRKDAGTDVVTDVLFFQRKAFGAPIGGEVWYDVAEVAAERPEEKLPALEVNEYFINYPEMVLGVHDWASTPHGMAYTCRSAGEDLEKSLADALAKLPKDIFVAADMPPGGGLNEGERGFGEFGRNNAEGATVREGSYLMQEGKLHQVIDRRAVPVTIRNSEHWDENGVSSRSAKIIEALIPVRDATRAILRAQEGNRDWTGHQEELKKAYAAFCVRFGAINKTQHIQVTNKKTGEVSEQVRTPNLSPFRDDPDWPLVAAIENYDVDTGIATEGAIFFKRVVNEPVLPNLATAADALSVCLNDLGRVDVAYIADSLAYTEEQVLAELAGAIYLNPENGDWEAADKYLAGPVRTKLAVARAAAEKDPAFLPNVEALEKAQPADLKPSQISAKLGSPWIDVEDIQSFAKEVLGVESRVYRVAALGTWSVEHHKFALHAASTTEWGTGRRHAGHLLEDALNASIPQIFDIFKVDGSEVRRINPTETEAAKEKLVKIKQAFQDWVWADGERAERLSRVYNDTMNNLVPRHFDGSHLTLSGASNVIEFYSHQKRAIWRSVADGSMYLAHAVGAGKTFTMAAAIMEQKRLGLITKAMMVVPGHCLAQASKEFVLLYPNAKILVADETNFSKAKRQRFVARAATGDWDCIIITHSAFKFIDVPADFERDLIQDQLDELELLLDEADTEDRVSRKRIEAQKEKHKAMLEALKARKDDLLTISEIGVDQLVIDEAQEFRKLSFATNQSSLKGVDADGSQRAWDAFVKAKFTEQKNPGRALIMASGTPITNTIGELYTLERFFCPDLLERLNLKAFDAWALNFGEVRTELELQPSGGYRQATRFSEFVNVPELVDIFRLFADIVQPDDLRQNVRVPNLAGGVRQVITAPATRMFKGYQRALERRIKKIESRHGQPTAGEDILLSVINDGRHAAIDLRLIDPGLPNDSESKLNMMIDNVFKIYQETAEREYYSAPGFAYERKGGAQLIFSDLGTPAAEDKRGFSVYSWTKRRLIEMGVPADEIAIIHDYPKAADKLRLYSDLKAGIKRICIGSTKKMGTGMNAQLRLVALHHLDVPWLPADVEQRDGRIRRQGNQNEEIMIFCYATLTSMDAALWSALSRKQKFISAAMAGDRSIRRLEDTGSQENQFAMAKAIASGDQRLMKKAGLENEIARLYRLKDAHIDSQMSIRREITDARNSIEYNSRKVEIIKKDIAARVPTAGDSFGLSFNGMDYTERKKAGEAIIAELLKSARGIRGTVRFIVGGHEFGMKLDFKLLSKAPDFELSHYRSDAGLSTYEISGGVQPLGLIIRIENILKGLEEELERHAGMVDRAQRRLADYEPRLGGKFEFQAELEAKITELGEIEKDLASTGDDQGARFDEYDEIANMFHLRGAAHVPFVEPTHPANDDQEGEGEEIEAA